MDRSFSSPRIASSNISWSFPWPAGSGTAAGERGPAWRGYPVGEAALRYIGSIYRFDISTRDIGCRQTAPWFAEASAGNERSMRRIAFMLTLAAMFLVALALPAAADYPPGGTTQTPEVLGKTVNAAPGTAFTGSTVIPLMVLGTVLLVLGTGLVFISRRVRHTAGS